MASLSNLCGDLTIRSPAPLRGVVLTSNSQPVAAAAAAAAGTVVVVADVAQGYK